MESVKQWIDLTADMGYNCLMLNTEDTYEVDDNPYFGYMRGRYTQKELKELDAYASVRKEHDFWTERRMTECGLNRYDCEPLPESWSRGIALTGTVRLPPIPQ